MHVDVRDKYLLLAAAHYNFFPRRQTARTRVELCGLMTNVNYTNAQLRIRRIFIAARARLSYDFSRPAIPPAIASLRYRLTLAVASSRLSRRESTNARSRGKILCPLADHAGLVSRNYENCEMRIARSRSAHRARIMEHD